jgi:hypothetical protein
MIEPRIVPAEAKMSAGINGAYTRGMFCKLSGKFTTAVGNAGKAGAGEAKLILATGTDADNVKGLVYPIDKLTLLNEDSDSSYDTLASGDRVIYYTAGTFDTDQFNTTGITSSTAIGTKLFVQSDGKLNIESGTVASGSAVAIFLKFNTVGTANEFNDSARYASNTITYRLL